MAPLGVPAAPYGRQVLRSALCVVVTLVVVTLVVVTLVVVTLVVVTLVVAKCLGAQLEVVQVDLSARRVDDLGLVKNSSERLATGNLGHHPIDLAAFLHRLGELVGVHAVLL